AQGLVAVGAPLERVDPSGPPAASGAESPSSDATLSAGLRAGRALPGSEPALARLELVQRLPERLAAEVGPQLLAEYQLGVRALPQQVVGDPQLAAGADQEIRVVHVGRV